MCFPGETLQRPPRKSLRRSADPAARPPETPAMPEGDRGGRASGHGDGVTPRPAPYVIDDAAIAAAAAEIATLQSRIEAATGTVKERLSAARAEIASLQQRLADAEKASAAPRTSLCKFPDRLAPR